MPADDASLPPAPGLEFFMRRGPVTAAFVPSVLGLVFL